MQSLNRERELQEILAPLTSVVSGNPTPGNTRVLCRGVSCPPRGGLTIFLDDLAESMRGNARFLPIRLTLAELLHAEAELKSASEVMAGQIGRTGALDGQPETLVSLAESVWQSGRLAVLILDASAALTQIRKTDELRDRAGSNRLLIALRALPNLIRHHSASFAVVLGCHDDFLDHAADWGAQDIVQRYRLVSLWPDFGEAEPWPIYRKILEARGCRVLDDFSGFPRSHLPVGEVLAALNGPGQEVDGPFLLELLARHGKVNKARAIDSQLAIALALQDRTLEAADVPLLEAVREPSARWASHPIEGGRYQATTELYESLGISPSRVRLSFAERLRRRFEIDHEPQVAHDVLRGVRALAGADDVPVESAEEFAATIVPLPDAWRPPNVMVQPSLRVYACIAEALPQSLQDEVQTHVERIERDALQTRELVVVLHREPAMGVQLRGKVAERLKARNTEFINLSSGGARGSRDAPSGLCTVQLIFPVVQGVVSFGLDGELQDDFVDQARNAFASGLRDHYAAVTRFLKSLSPRIFEGQVLSRLIASTPAALTLRELQGVSGGLTLSRVQEIVRGLEGVSAIQKENDGYSWTYASDGLLTQFPAGEPRRAVDLVRRFFFDASNWPHLAESMRVAYSSDLLGGSGDVVEGRDPSPLLESRARGIIRQIDEQKRQLRDAGDLVALGGLASSLEEKRQLLGGEPDVAKLEQACDGLWKLYRRGSQLLTDVEGRRIAFQSNLSKSADALRKWSEVHDGPLQSARDQLLSELTEAVAIDGVSLVDLTKLQRRVAELQQQHKAETHLRESNVQIAVQLAERCRRLLNRLDALSTEDAGLSDRRAKLKDKLNQAKDAIGDAKQHPAVAGEFRSKQLDALSIDIEDARKNLHQLGIENAAVHAQRPPLDTPANSPSPRIFLTSPQSSNPEPLATTSEQRPGEAVPPTDTLKAVNEITSAPTCVTREDSSAEPIRDEPPLSVLTATDLPPLVTRPFEAAPTTPDPRTTSFADPPVTLPQSSAPSPKLRVYRFGPDQLDQLADVLRQHPDIVKLEVIE
jgi:hypothetical protein